jgi:hypothetical protein
MEGREAGTGASVCRERGRLADEAAGKFLLIVAGTDNGLAELEEFLQKTHIANG